MQIFEELYEFNEKLLVSLKYDRKPVEKVAENFKYITEILHGKEVLNGDDGRFISDYFTTLGKSDALSQIDYLSAKSSSLLKLKEESFADYKKYSSLYLKIFFMLGVLAAVLLA